MLSIARLDADDAVVGEADRRIGQQAHRLQEVVGHHRVVDVQLEVALAAGEGHGGVVAEDLDADLVSASHWVGLTLPGMIEEPGSFSGSDSSPRPARGPEPRKRMSLAILNSSSRRPC
jgi:hypothetical protein